MYTSRESASGTIGGSLKQPGNTVGQLCMDRYACIYAVSM
jgi:hypothetical protein